MRRLITLALILPVIVALTSCKPYQVTGLPNSENTRVPSRYQPTRESAWIGTYTGSGTLNILETGNNYANSPVCMEIRVEKLQLEPGREFRAVVADIHMSAMPAPLDLEDVSDGYYMGDESECTGDQVGLVLESYTSVRKVISEDTLSLYGPLMGQQWTAGKQQRVLITRQNGELLVLVYITRWQCKADGTWCTRNEAAKFNLLVTEAK
ncbi:MAG: hypothetical protein JSW51_03455 [Gemmatimonadota bacterium]|nr:MAG: hypothetical protein JSW51_03455 [Gemmatimonadota bacterium]